jgi:hypothetical protein
VKLIAEFEKGRNPNFSVRGFSERYRVYASHFQTTLDFYIFDVVEKEAGDVLTKNQFEALGLGNAGLMGNYKPGLDALGDQMSAYLEDLIEVREFFKMAEVDCFVFEWIIPGEKRSKLISYVDPYYPNPSKAVSKIDAIVYDMIESLPHTVG